MNLLELAYQLDRWGGYGALAGVVMVLAGLWGIRKATRSAEPIRRQPPSEEPNTAYTAGVVKVGER